MLVVHPLETLVRVRQRIEMLRFAAVSDFGANESPAVSERFQMPPDADPTRIRLELLWTRIDITRPEMIPGP